VMETVYIYSLEYPEGNIRYIGKSTDPVERLKSHINDSMITTNSHKTAWIRGLLNSGVEPIMNIVDEVCKSEWSFWEKFYISLFKTYGFSLTNSTEGGDGNCNPSECVRGKISESLKGYFKENDVWNKGVKGLSLGWEKGKKQTEEHTRKAREARNKRLASGEIQVWNKGLKGVQEIWNKGLKGVMPEPWNKGTEGVMVAWNKGISMGEESKKKLSESMRESYKNKGYIECTYCNKLGITNKFMDSHFENCKLKPKPVAL
jgi:hypothetical protein